MRRIGYLTIWEHESSLTRQLEPFFSSLEPDSFAVFADRRSGGGATPAYVERCWERRSDRLSDLRSAVSSRGVSILHIIGQDHTPFADPAFVSFLGELRRDGIKVVFQAFDTYTLDPAAASLFSACDLLIVSTPHAKLELVANGAGADKVALVLPGVPELSGGEDRVALRLRHRIPHDERVILTFGHVQPNKGMEAVIESVARLVSKGQACRGIVAGRPNPNHLGSRDYLAQLRAVAGWSGVSDKIHFIDRFVPDSELIELIRLADLVILNNHSQTHEISRAAFLALAAGALLATSVSPAFAVFGDAVWQMSAGFPPALSTELLLSNGALREQLLAGAARFRREHSMGAHREALFEIYSRLGWERREDASSPSAGAPSSAGPAFAPAATLYDLNGDATELQDLIEMAEMATRSLELQRAHELFDRAERLGVSTRLLRGRGAAYLAEGNPSAAAMYFERAVALDETDSKSHCGLGMCGLRSGDPSGAEEHLVRALDHDPHSVLALRHLVEAAYSIGRFESLERCLRRYLADHPRDVEMRFCLAGCLFKAGRRAEADDVAARILSDSPGHDAARELREIIAKGGDAPRREVLPSVSAGYDEIDRALDELEEKKRQKKLEDVRGGCSRLLGSGRLSEGQRQRTRILEAEINLLSGDVDLARKAYDEVLVVNPKSARALCGKGVIAANGNSLDLAMMLFEQARSIDPRYDVALSGLGLCMQLRNESDKAWDFYVQALESNPENSRALLGAIELGYKLRRLEDLERILESYIDMHPADLDFLYALAGCYYAQGKLGEATETVNKVLLFDDGHRNARELRDAIEDRLELERQAS